MPLSVGSMPTQDVVFCEAPASATGTRTELENAVLEIDVRADGTCDRFEATGDLVLEGPCRVEVFVEPESRKQAAKKRYVIGTWAGSCSGTFVLDEDSTSSWRLVKDDHARCLRLVPFDGTLLLFR